jgi:hypothetical protein
MFWSQRNIEVKWLLYLSNYDKKFTEWNLSWQCINDEDESCILMIIGSGRNHGEAISGLLLKKDYDDAGKGSNINIPSQSKDVDFLPLNLCV